MRVIFLVCTLIVAVTAAECLGATAVPVTTKIIQKDIIACPTQNEGARQSYNEGLRLQKEGKLRAAEASYLKAIELDPGYCDAMDDLGVMLRNEGATDQAISWYKRSLSVKPDNTVAHQNLAVAYQILGDAGKSVAEFQWLIQHDPNNPEGYYGLGNVHLATGETEAAIGSFKRAEELYRANSSPLLADAQYELGVAYYILKNYQKARDYFLLVYPGRENDPNINYLLGICYLDPSIGDLGKAREHLFKAQKLGVNIPAEVLRKLGK